MHSYVTSKNVQWCHLVWATLYVRPEFVSVLISALPSLSIYLSI